MRSFIPAVAAAAALTLVLTGCASGPVASATAVDNAVSIQQPAGEPKPVATTADVHVGETVATDDVGLSEVVFADKSYTRVGPSSTLKIVELSTADKQRSITSLDLGESWHRVKKLTAEDSTYQVKTPVGTASVRGTAFSAVCKSKAECEFVVIEGIVEVTLKDGTKVTVHPFERLAVPGGTANPYPIDAVKANPWVMKNLELDGIQLADAAKSAGIGDWEAALAGTWHAKYTVLAETDPRRAANVGSVLETDWTAEAGDCTTDGCTLSVVSTKGAFDIAISPVGMTWQSSEQANCVDEVTGELRAEYGFDAKVVTELQPTSVEMLHGIPTVTELTGTRTATWTLKSPPDPNCADVSAPVSTETISVVVKRTDG